MIAGLLSMAAPASFASSWSFDPSLRILGGHESALLLDPGGAAIVVPGGVFVDLGPALTVDSPAGRKGRLQFGTEARLERFFNTENRTLYAQSLWGDYRLGLTGAARARVSLNGNYFNDTEQPGLRRFQGGTELGLGLFRPAWSLEAFTSAHRVAYPRAESVDAAGRPVDYRETRLSAGLEGALSPIPTLRLRGNVVARNADSVLPEFDSHSILAGLELRWSPSRSWRVDGFYGFQTRRFDDREPGLDEDEYQQWGAGLAYLPSQGVELRVRWSEGRYRNTQGEDEPTDRFELGLDLGPRFFGVPEAPPVLSRVSPLPTVNRGGALFRLRAPEASTVSVVGDFNGWDPQRHPLRAVGDGWWELRVPLSAGTHQYLYLVDGRALFPPESERGVEDGFGGRNGLIEVFPAPL